MGLIKYIIKSGSLPITVDLTGDSIQQNIHNSYEEGIFSVDFGTYTLTFTDDNGCQRTQDILKCTSCPDGYISIGEKCEKLLTDTVIDVSPYLSIAAKQAYSYTNKGTLIFDSFNVNGTGSFEKININNPYWINPYVNGVSLGGPMNRSAVWGTGLALVQQDVGFSYCINLPVSKIYYIGVGADNWSWIKLNGNIILNQDVDALETMLGSDQKQSPFKYWFIYPIFMEAGNNILEVYGHNESSLAAFGVEIYNATAETLKNATSDLDLGDSLLFRAKDKIGQNFDYTYSQLGGLKGFSCKPGYALNTCGENYSCERKIIVECGQLVAEVDEIVETFNEPCGEILYPEISDSIFSKQYIASNFFVPAILESDIENIQITLLKPDKNGLIKYGGVNIIKDQIIDFSSFNNIEFYTSAYQEIDTISTIGFKIKLIGEMNNTQEVLYTSKREACVALDVPVKMYVSIDTSLNGPYNKLVELQIPYNPGFITSFTQPVTSLAEYHYMFISIPKWVTVVLYDAIDNDITNNFVFSSEDNRVGFANNYIYKYAQPFGTSTSVAFKILVND